MNRIKKITAMLLFVTIMASYSFAVNYSDSWQASHAYYPGAPGGSGVTDYPELFQRASGATAYCNFNSHTNASATSGTTYISCETYSMTSVSIYNLGSASCNPNVGAPLTDIYVKYKVTCQTPTPYDTFVSKGNIIKN